MNSFFNWLKDSGTQAMLILVGTSAAIVAAVGTIYFGMKSLTKKDLSGVEENTAATSGHLQNVHTHLASLDARTKRQEEADVLANRAQLVPISVIGEALINEPLSVYLTGRTNGVRFTRIELRSELQNTFGMMECEQNAENPLQFVATIPANKLGNWTAAGTGVTMGITRQILRVWMSFEEKPTEAFRDMSVTVAQRAEHLNDISGRRVQRSYRIQGSV